MPPTLTGCKEQIRRLRPDSELMRQGELRRALAELRRKIRENGITPEQLFGFDLSTLVRYRDPPTGRGWNGFGRPPNWIRGKDRENYRVK